jgi:tetratricopeptide (TPR) repeat protein
MALNRNMKRGKFRRALIKPEAAASAPVGASGLRRLAGFFARHWWLPALILVFLTLTAYFPAIRGGFIWDDDLYAATPMLERADGLLRIWTLQPPYEHYYYEFPVVYTSYWLERKLWGLDPAGYHLVNIALHILNALLAWLLLKRLGLRFAWLAAALFALHPVHVESVAWISERKNVLSGLFYLLTLCCYLRFEDGRGRAWYLSAIGLFLLSLLSKPVTFTLPAVLLLLRWQRGLVIRRADLLNLAPFCLLSAAMALYTVHFEVRTLGLEGRLHVLQRVLLACRAVWFYPFKLALPVNLAFSYERWPLDVRSVTEWLWVLGVSGAGAYFWLDRRRLGRNFFTGLWFYLITICPLLGFLSNYTFQYSFVADHYQYLSSLGILTIAVGGLTRISGKDPAAPGSPGGSVPGRRVIFICLAALAFLWTGTRRQSGIYRNSETVWTDTIKKNPSSWLAHNNLGMIFMNQGRLEDAVTHFKEAVLDKPDLAEAYYNCGIALLRLNRPKEAIACNQEALRIRPNYPKAAALLVAVYNDLGIEAAQAGRLDESIRNFNAALKISPTDVKLRANLETVLGIK